MQREDDTQIGECWLEQFRRREATLCSVFDSVPPAIFWKDRDGIYLGCNKAFAQEVGLSDPRDIVGKTDSDLPWSREDAERYEATDRKVMESGTPERHVVRMVTRLDGTQAWMDVSIAPLLSREGHICGVLGVFDDVTDSVKAAEALRGAEARYKALVESTPVGIYLQQKGIIQYVNPSLARMAGYTSEEVIGRPLIEFIAPECRAEILQRLSVIYESSHFTTTMIRKDGERRCVEVDDRSIYIAGEHTAIGSVVDITDRLRAQEALFRSEAKYRSIYENAPIGIYQSTLDGRLLSANPTAARMFGYDSPDELVRAAADIHTALFVNPEQRADIVRQVLESVEFLRFENEYKRKDGTTFIANLYMRAVRQD